MSRRRPLSEDERTLWANVTRSIAPLRPRVRLPAAPSIERAEPASKATRKAAPPRVAPSHVAPPAKTAPPLAPLGRRLKQRVARGREPIDARIDLHGLTQAQAHAALLRFLLRAQADDVRIALVVTGKGARNGAGERGVLKRQVPMWLRLPEFSPYIVGFEDAHIGHGGEGALYVRVRRLR
jgi:DNA-nicking Smr family endonuclease